MQLLSRRPETSQPAQQLFRIILRCEAYDISWRHIEPASVITHAARQTFGELPTYLSIPFSTTLCTPTEYSDSQRSLI